MDLFELKCFIFDMDGVLLDSMLYWYKEGISIVEPYAKYPLDIQDPEVKNKAWKVLRAQGKEKCDELIEKWHELMADCYTRVEMKEYVIEFLEKCKKLGIKLCIGTATPLSLAVPCLKRLGLYDYFEDIEDEDSSNEPKYTGKLYNNIREHMNLKENECAIFEDNAHNLQIPHKQGFVTVGVYDFISRNRLDKLKENSDIYIESFKDLL